MNDYSFEVLCSTMNRTDFSVAMQMHIQSDALFINQSNTISCAEMQMSNSTIRMISSDQIGIGKSRNLALLHAKADICLLSDDDVIFVDNYQKIICDAFKKSNADIIIFGLEGVGGQHRTCIDIKEIKQLRFWNKCPYGGPRIAFKRESLMRANIWFTTLFGGGSVYSSGEDSAFLINAIRSNLKVYINPTVIASTDLSKSTWFDGYNEKYFFDKGAYYKFIFPKTWVLRALYTIVSMKNKTSLSKKKVFLLMKAGSGAFYCNKKYTEDISGKDEI